jgi:uncharacterized protein
MSDADLGKPLSQDEFNQLERLLDSDLFRGDALLPDELQGFFFAVASAPDFIPPSRWLPAVIGEAPDFAGDGEAQRALELIMRFYNHCVKTVAGEDFELILYRDENDELDFAPWCSGYLAGVELSEEDWMDVGDAEEIGELLFPFIVLANALPDEERRVIKPAEWRQLVQSCQDSLGDAIAQIHAYWLVVRSPPTTVRRDTPKPGRNDRCPCGSGKKWKQCCGAPGALH